MTTEKEKTQQKMTQHEKLQAKLQKIEEQKKETLQKQAEIRKKLALKKKDIESQLRSKFRTEQRSIRNKFLVAAGIAVECEIRKNDEFLKQILALSRKYLNGKTLKNFEEGITQLNKNANEEKNDIQKQVE